MQGNNKVGHLVVAAKHLDVIESGIVSVIALVTFNFGLNATDAGVHRACAAQCPVAPGRSSRCMDYRLRILVSAH